MTRESISSTSENSVALGERNARRRTVSARRRGGDGDAFTPRLAFERYQRDQDPEALAWLLGEYRVLATRLALRFYRHREPLDDLQQVAFEGLLQAMRRFDPDFGLPFEVFATSTIAGTLKRHYRDRGWSIRVPRAVHDTFARVRRLSDELTQRDGRAPTIAELAVGLTMSEDDVIEVLAAGSSRNVRSLDIDVYDGRNEPVSWSASDGALARIEDRESVRRMLADLPSLDQEVIRLYFFENLSQAEMGRKLGCSQVQISRLLRRVLNRLRARLVADAEGGWPSITADEPHDGSCSTATRLRATRSSF
jgi:RNA polymerase sigma-B factor